MSYTSVSSATKRYDPRSPGKVFVEKASLLDDIVDDDQELSYTNRRLLSRMNKSSTTTEKGTTTSQLLEERRQLELAQTESLMRQNIQKALDRAFEKQERDFPIILSNVDRATNYLDQIDKELSLHDETQRNKVRRQFEEWNTNVHGSIQVCSLAQYYNCDCALMQSG